MTSAFRATFAALPFQVVGAFLSMVIEIADCTPVDGQTWDVHKSEIASYIEADCADGKGFNIHTGECNVGSDHCQLIVSTCPDNKVVCATKVNTFVWNRDMKEEFTVSCKVLDCSRSTGFRGWTDTKGNSHYCRDSVGVSGSSSSSSPAFFLLFSTIAVAMVWAVS